jgi:hypothetical protein
MIAGRRARSATLSIPGLTADYTRLPAGTGPSITAGHAIGVAFTPQRQAVWSVGRATSRAGRLPPASVFVVPAEGLEWAAWTPIAGAVHAVLVSATMAGVMLPVNADIPDIDTFFVEEHDPHASLIGARGIGELGAVGIAPAIVNAVYHATGKRVRDLPIRIDRLLDQA